jgi:hypothetical protein
MGFRKCHFLANGKANSARDPERKLNFFQALQFLIKKHSLGLEPLFVSLIACVAESKWYFIVTFTSLRSIVDELRTSNYQRNSIVRIEKTRLAIVTSVRFYTQNPVSPHYEDLTRHSLNNRPEQS